jgi:ketosteroid isomerase-like protein
MTTAEIATTLVELCRQGEFEKATNALYSPDIVSVEAFSMNNMPRQTNGLDGVLKKGQWWTSNHTVHAITVTGPFVALDKFAVVFDMDITNKPTGKRMKMTEVAVYTVTDGKIVHEEFLYQAP